MNCGAVHTCERCGDRLIHQRFRSPNESSSSFGQFIHDSFPNDFFRCDDDEATHYKLATKIWRDIEHKFDGQVRSRGQVVTMQKRALAIRELIALHLVHPDSGSFVVWSDPPFASGSVSKVDPTNGSLFAPVELEAEKWVRFLTGLEMGL